MSMVYKRSKLRIKIEAMHLDQCWWRMEQRRRRRRTERQVGP